MPLKGQIQGLILIVVHVHGPGVLALNPDRGAQLIDPQGLKEAIKRSRYYNVIN